MISDFERFAVRVFEGVKNIAGLGLNGETFIRSFSVQAVLEFDRRDFIPININTLSRPNLIIYGSSYMLEGDAMKLFLGFVTGFLIFNFGTAFAETANPLPAWRSKIAAGVAELQKANLFVGGIVAVTAGENSDYWNLGVESPNSSSAPNPDQVFEIGSISKSFTGILLAELVIEKRANLADTVETFIPELKGTFSGHATLEQLATHTSGLPSGICEDKTKPECFVAPDPKNPYARQEWSAILRFLLNFSRPDSGPYPNAYSNLGFELLGAVVTRIDDRSFEEMLAERITGPLRMTSSSVKLTVSQKSRFINGFDLFQHLTPHWDFDDAAAPAGGIRSTGHDMMLYLKANLKPASNSLGLAMALSQSKSLGWDSDPGAPTIWKNGETGGFANILLISPKAQVGYVQLTNQGAALSQNLQLLISGQPMPEIPKYPVDPNVLASEVGTYVLRGGSGQSAKFEVKPFGYSLAIYNDGTGMRLFAKNEIDFDLYDGVYPVGSTKLSFTRTANQTVGFVLHIPGAPGKPGKDLICDRTAD